jgi:hypothetical protein
MWLKVKGSFVLFAITEKRGAAELPLSSKERGVIRKADVG